VSGDQYSRYGGDTTCIEVIAKSGETIIIDAGTGIRCLGNSLIERKISRYYLLFTHAHWDHIQGFAFFRPLLSNKAKLMIQDREFLGVYTKALLNKVMEMPFFPIGLKDLKADIKFDQALTGKFNIGSLSIETIPTSHPGGGLGYKFIEDGKSFVFLTDNELGFDHPGGVGFDAYMKFSQNVDLLFHDAEYTDDEYQQKGSWGHSSIQTVLDLALKANVKKFGMFHLNQDRTDDQMDSIVSKCRKDLKKMNSTLDCFAVPCNMEIHL
jgi:phosphoribosyl 1,2-cyclic phosphodiesterase